MPPRTCSLLLAGAAVSALVTACPAPLCQSARVRPPLATTIDAGVVALEAREITLELVVGSRITCEGSVAAPERVTPEVLDPYSKPVASSGELLDETLTGQDYTYVLRFQPRGPGWYHVNLYLDEAGLVQENVLVVADRSADPSFELAAGCEQLAGPTSSGAVVCDGVLLRPDGGATSFGDPGEGAAVAGATVWSYHDAGVRGRWVDLGDSLSRDPESASAPFASPPLLVVADERHLLAVSQSDLRTLSIERIALDGGVLSADGLRQLALEGTNPLALLAGDRLYVSTHLPQLDAGFPLGSAHSRVCGVALGPTAQLDGGCQTFSGNIVGTGEGGLWLRLDNALKLYAPVEGGGVEVAALMNVAAAGAMAAIRGGGSAPQFSAGVSQQQLRLVPRLLPEGIIFDAYALEAPWRWGGASDELIWLRDPQQHRVRVYRR